jgi:hypothetical protein
MRRQAQMVHERARGITEGVAHRRPATRAIGGNHLGQLASIERDSGESLRLHQGENPAHAIDGDGLTVPDELVDGAHPARCIQKLRGRIDLERSYY